MISTNYLVIAVALAILATAVAVWLTGATRVLFRYRGKMLFTCPETGKAACVKIAAGDAARSSLTGRPKIHLSECSHWPGRQNCGQACLSQLGADPQNCLLWTKVSDWYRGRACAYCHKPFLELHWHDHRPALVGHDGKTVQWSEVAPEKLPELFETHLPVCWSCHIAETFRREHPERVVDRPANRGPMGEFLTNHEERGASASLTARN
jgi:hypothetical protein